MIDLSPKNAQPTSPDPSDAIQNPVAGFIRGIKAPVLDFKTYGYDQKFFSVYEKYTNRRDLKDFLTLGLDYYWIADNYDFGFAHTLTRAQQEQWIEAHRRIPPEMIDYYGAETAVPEFEPCQLGKGTFLLGSNKAFAYANSRIPSHLDVTNLDNGADECGFFLERIPHYQFPWLMDHRYFYSCHVTDVLIDALLASEQEHGIL